MSFFLFREPLDVRSKSTDEVEDAAGVDFIGEEGVVFDVVSATLVDVDEALVIELVDNGLVIFFVISFAYD